MTDGLLVAFLVVLSLTGAATTVSLRLALKRLRELEV
jgi:hypothetical protein